MRRFLVMTVAVLVSVTMTSACSGDDDEAIGTRDDWCAVIGQVDDMFEATDSSSDPFAVKQQEYAEINDLLDQLASALDQVDEDERDAVAEAIDWAARLTDAMVAATDQADAEAAVGAIFEEYPQGGLPGGAWILDACGVDVNS